ncbi:MAG: hypothetical protein K2N49_04870, partial [Ruminococcus sp.]|nr:hypothetical protein [Ruminococcus sp.]
MDRKRKFFVCTAVSALCMAAVLPVSVCAADSDETITTVNTTAVPTETTAVSDDITEPSSGEDDQSQEYSEEWVTDDDGRIYYYGADGE